MCTPAWQGSQLEDVRVLNSLLHGSFSAQVMLQYLKSPHKVGPFSWSRLVGFVVGGGVTCNIEKQAAAVDGRSQNNLVYESWSGIALAPLVQDHCGFFSHCVESMWFKILGSRSYQFYKDGERTVSALSPWWLFPALLLCRMCGNHTSCHSAQLSVASVSVNFSFVSPCDFMFWGRHNSWISSPVD